MSELLITVKHGLSLDLLTGTFLFAMMLCTPILTAWYFNRPVPEAFDAWFIRGVFLSLAVTAVIASTPGAGPHHLLPLVTVAVFGLLPLIKAPKSRPRLELNNRELGIMVLVPLLVFYANGEINWAKTFFINEYLTSQKELKDY